MSESKRGFGTRKREGVISKRVPLVAGYKRGDPVEEGWVFYKRDSPTVMVLFSTARYERFLSERKIGGYSYKKQAKKVDKVYKEDGYRDVYRACAKWLKEKGIENGQF